MTIFKEEKMPGKGSECTSLSSLTIDDDLPGVSDKYITNEYYLYKNNNNNNSCIMFNVILLDEIAVHSRSKCFTLIK